MDFVFIEDRDWETGHGWRDLNHRFILNPFSTGPDERDRDVVVQILDDNGNPYNKYDIRYLASYAWICPKEYWDQYHHVKDNVRTKMIKDHYPKFKGISNMESHFEFRMNPYEMRRHLLNIGMVEVKR